MYIKIIQWKKQQHTAYSFLQFQFHIVFYIHIHTHTHIHIYIYKLHSG